MTRTRLLALLLFGPLALALAGCDRDEPARYQGYVEADFLFVGPDEAGRLTLLAVAEGDRVELGATLFAVDDSLERAARDRAKADLEEAKARLARLQAAQQRPEEIAVLQAAESRAKAALALSQRELERQQKLIAHGNTSQAALDAAQATYDQDQAALDEIRQQIQVANLASHELDIAAATRRVDSAQEELSAAEARLTRRQIAAPAAGTIQEVYFRQGEVVPAAGAVVSLLPPGNLKVRFFVPQAVLPKLAPGQAVTVTCDGCGEPLTARITFLSTEAEYTPPVIYSLEERSKLVFMIEARPDAPERLRVGQPVTVTPEEER